MPTSFGGAIVEAFSEKEAYHWLAEPTADIKLRVPWSLRNDYAEAIMGMLWPYNTAVAMYAVDVQVSPVPNTKTYVDGDHNVYQTAFLDVHFDPFVTFTEKLKTNGEMLKVNRYGLYLGEDEAPHFQAVMWQVGENEYELVSQEETPSKIITGIDYTVSFEDLDVLPEEILTLTDCCNEDAVTPINLAGLEFDPETILLLNTDANHIVKVDGSVKNSLTLNFGWRKNGWNKFWRASTRSWEYQYLVPVADADIPRLSEAHPQPFEPDPDADEPVIYRNFPMQDFSALLPTV